MTDVLQQTIEALAAKIDQEQQAFMESLNRRKALVNGLCGEAGVEPRYPDIGDAIHGAGATAINGGARNGSSLSAQLNTIKPDQFYGQSLSGSIRKVLEMRKSANLGPADVKDIYTVLVQGGYAFETKNTETAVQGLTVSIGKNSALFVKLPNGQVGLKEWYPGARSTRKRDNVTSDDTSLPAEEELVETSADGKDLV